MDNRIKSVFGEYAKQLQVLVETNLDKFKVPFFQRFFQLGSPQMGLTYSTIIGRSRIEAAASIVAHGAEAPLRSRMGLEKLSGEIAAVKVKRKMDDQDYREWLTMQAVSTNEDAKKQQIIQLIWDDVKYVVDAVSTRMDWMAAQALSQGRININLTNNPDGIAPGTIDLLVPAANREGGSAAFEWGAGGADNYWVATDGGTGSASTPISDIRGLTRRKYNDTGVVFEKVLMTPGKWWEVEIAPEITTLFDGRPSLEEFNSYMQSQGLPIIELVDVRTRVEADGVLTTVDPWVDDRYIVFLPGGNAGIMHNSLSIEQIRPVPSVDYAISNNILVSKWAQTEPFGEFTRGEIAAFPGLEVASQMHLVDVESVGNWGA